MWGRDKNFQVSMLYELRNCENKISLTKVFYFTLYIGIDCVDTEMGRYVGASVSYLTWKYLVDCVDSR